MPDKVIDASAMAALAFAEAGAGLVLDEIDGHRLHAPELLAYELMNVAWKRARRQKGATTLFLESLEILAGLGVHYRSVDRRGVIVLGLATGLTAYDASYLWLARSLGVPLVTLDRKLGQVFDAQAI
jgi:predicted nucleic acid-binding protein